MTTHAVPDLPAPAGPADPPPAPALLTSGQLMATLGLTRRMLKDWNHLRVIPSTGRGRARRYELAQVMAALWAHGQPDTAAASSASSSTPPGMGGPAGMAADFEYQFLPH